MLRISIKENLRNLENLEAGLADLRPALRKIGAWQERSTIQNFARQASPINNTPWAPLQPSTLEARRGSSANILADTGALRRSVRAQVRGDRVVMQSNLEYAATHQFGDSSRNIPQRQYVGTSPQDERAYERIIRRHLRGGA